jgi:hypothetical protein
VVEEGDQVDVPFLVTVGSRVKSANVDQVIHLLLIHARPRRDLFDPE